MASAIPFIAKELDLSPTAMGGVLSAFFVGYSIMQIPGGLLADRFGPNRIMTMCIVAWSVGTALTGMAGSLTSMLMARVLFGLSEGPFPPSASKSISLWFPADEIGRANGLQLAAVNIGAAFAPLLVAPLIGVWGWRSAFYVLLVPGFVLALAVYALAKDPPSLAMRVSRPKPAVSRMPLLAVLRTPGVFFCALTLFFGNIAGWGLINWLPSYLLQARGFSVTKMGVFAALPFIAGAIGYYLGGHISDKLFKFQRKIPIGGGLILGGAMTYLAAIAPSGEWAVAALAFAFLFLFVSSAGTFTLPLVLAPGESVGVVFGVVNTFGQIAAFLSPLLVGYLLDATHRDFALVFYCIVGVFGLAALLALQIRQPGPSVDEDCLRR